MPFAEPRPHRRPFHAKGEQKLTIVPTRTSMNLAVTSFTVANNDSSPHFVRLVSTHGSNEELLLEVLVPGETTKHFPFPHPLMVGVGRSLVAEDEISGFLSPMTVVGYEWLPADEPQNLPASLRKKSTKRR
jgi:hypothetical protein